MACIVKKKIYKFIKKTLYDVWGHHIRYRQLSRTIRYLRKIKRTRRARYKYYNREMVFRFGKKLRFYLPKRIKRSFLKKRYLKFFYLVLSYRNFRRYMDIAKRKTGYFYSNYYVLLEGRIFMMAYRSSFITNIFKIKFIIRHGLFCVNGIVRCHYNFVVRPGDLFQVNFFYKKYIVRDFLMRIRQGIIYTRLPKYLFANYNFMFVFFWRSPRKNEIIFGVRWVDVFLGSTYTYP